MMEGDLALMALYQFKLGFTEFDKMQIHERLFSVSGSGLP